MQDFESFLKILHQPTKHHVMLCFGIWISLEFYTTKKQSQREPLNMCLPRISHNHKSQAWDILNFVRNRFEMYFAIAIFSCHCVWRVLTWCWRPGWCPRAWVCHPVLDLSSLGCCSVSGWVCTPCRTWSWTTPDHWRGVRQMLDNDMILSDHIHIQLHHPHNRQLHTVPVDVPK